MSKSIGGRKVHLRTPSGPLCNLRPKFSSYEVSTSMSTAKVTCLRCRGMLKREGRP